MIDANDDGSSRASAVVDAIGRDRSPADAAAIREDDLGPLEIAFTQTAKNVEQAGRSAGSGSGVFCRNELVDVSQIAFRCPSEDNDHAR